MGEGEYLTVKAVTLCSMFDMECILYAVVVSMDEGILEDCLYKGENCPAVWPDRNAWVLLSPRKLVCTEYQAVYLLITFMEIQVIEGVQYTALYWCGEKD